LKRRGKREWSRIVGVCRFLFSVRALDSSGAKPLPLLSGIEEHTIGGRRTGRRGGGAGASEENARPVEPRRGPSHQWSAVGTPRPDDVCLPRPECHNTPTTDRSGVLTGVIYSPRSLPKDRVSARTATSSGRAFRIGDRARRARGIASCIRILLRRAASRSRVKITYLLLRHLGKDAETLEIAGKFLGGISPYYAELGRIGPTTAAGRPRFPFFFSFFFLVPCTLRTIASLPRRSADSRIRICGGHLSGYTLRSINRIGGPGFPGRWSRRRS